ncbi:MAG: O-antigen ligase family protein [Patescibacteria group bacterium]
MISLARINKYLLWLTLVAIPWQLRHTLLFAEHQGEFFEYASISIYLSDILIGALLLTWLIIPGKSEFKIGPRVLFWSLSGLIAWMWVSVWYTSFTTGNWLVGINNAAHFTLFYLFYLYLVNRVEHIYEVIVPLIAGMALQAGIAISQYLANHSLGWKFLGESDLDPAVLGIPVVMIDGARHLRAHGTLPHANILGGYLAAIFPWVLMMYIVIKSWWRRWVVWAVLVAGATAILFSFSRTAWLAVGVAVIVWGVGKFFYSRHWRWSWLSWLAGGVVLAVMINQYTAILSRLGTDQIALERESVVSRVEQLDQFKSVYDKYALTGIGIGQYTLYLEKQDLGAVGWHYDQTSPGWVYNLSHQVWDYQPVHNLWLMALAELGWIGGILFLLVVLIAALAVIRLVIIRKDLVSFTAAVSYLAVLLTGSFDHYLWTLQQGRLILFLSVGIIALLCQQNNLNHAT